jgi:hypothetical protein
MLWRGLGSAEGLELLGRIMGQDSTPHRPPTQAPEGLEAAMNRGRLQLLDVAELVAGSASGRWRGGSGVTRGDRGCAGTSARIV